MGQRSLREVRLLRREPVTPGMVRLHFGGPGLAGFVSTGVGDEFVRLFFPDASGRIVPPLMHGDGSYSFRPGLPRPHSEVYTLRAVDAGAGTLAIDFAVHEGGRASAWARAAQPGEALLMTCPPHAAYAPPAGARRQVLLCDATGLPAACRILEGLPDAVRVLAIAEVAQAAHRQPLTSRARVEAVWLEGSGNGLGPSRLPAALRAAVPSQPLPDYVWMGAEQDAVRAVREHLRQALALPAPRCSLMGYWSDRRRPHGRAGAAAGAAGP